MTVNILVGDCREQLLALPDCSVHCIITSPPYFGLRNYGVDGQMGLEPTPDEFVAALVAVLREARRVLRNDGTLWLNLGDSYAGSGRGGNPTRESSTLDGGLASQEASMIVRTRKVTGGTARAAAVTQRGSRGAGKHEQSVAAGAIGRYFVPPPSGLKQKDLIGIPWRVAFALQADGWYLRQDIIWSKPNPMPESVRDRCTKAHEYIFMLSKSRRYHYDADAIKEPAVYGARGSRYDTGKTGEHQLGRASDKQRGHGRRHAGFNERYFQDPAPQGTFGGKGAITGTGQQAFRAIAENEMRNKRSVWTVTTKPFKGAHFATFPPDLIEPCLLAGCPIGGTVLDPFGGAGTTGLVAQQHGRNAVLIELNPEYAAMARARIDAPAKPKRAGKRRAPSPANDNVPAAQADLFAGAA